MSGLVLAEPPVRNKERLNAREETPPTPEGETYIAFILDKSGSMSDYLSQVIAGYNRYMREQRRQGGSLRTSLTLFNAQVETVYENKDAADVPPLNRLRYRPEGGTALYDGVGEAIERTEIRVRGSVKVLVVVMTDGGENSSVYWRLDQIKTTIGIHQRIGWQFVYIGPDRRSALDMGFRSGDIMGFGEIVRGDGMKRLARDTAAFRARLRGEETDFFAIEGGAKEG